MHKPIEFTSNTLKRLVSYSVVYFRLQYCINTWYMKCITIHDINVYMSRIARVKVCR